MQITAVGEASATFIPERATVSLTLGFEGYDRAQVMTRTAHLASDFAAHVESLRGRTPAAITWSALLPASVRSWRPSADGAQRHEASWVARVRFRDFVALTEFLEKWGACDGVRVSSVEWTLTDATRRREEAAMLALAVQSARARGQAMATAAGAGSVRFVELVDPGLVDPAPADPQTLGSRCEGVMLQPEDVELTARVEARFATD